MNIFSLVMLGIGLISILFGFLFGLRRGLYKSIIRLAIVVICVLVTFLITKKITDLLLNIPVNGKPLIDVISESLTSGNDAESMRGLVDVIVNIIKMVAQIIVFIVTFTLLRIISMIPYCIISIIVCNSKKESENITEDDNNKNRPNKKKWFGGLVGIVQSIIIIACTLGPINGLASNGSSLLKSLSTVEVDGKKVVDGDFYELLDDLGFLSYSDTVVCKMYNLTGSGIYKSISIVKDNDGEKVNIQSQIEAIDGGVKMVDAVLDFTKVDTSNGFTEEVKDSLVDIFNELDTIKNDMSEESVKELDNLINDVLVPMINSSNTDIPINLEDVNFTDVDFAKEGEVISSFYDLIDKAENGEELNQDEVLEEVVNNLSDSTLILPVLSQIVEDLPEEEKINLSEEQKTKVKELIDNLDNKQNVEELKALFGIE